MNNLVIHKFNLEYGTNALMLPEGSKVLSAKLQNSKLVIWVLLNPDASKRKSYLFFVLATGELVFKSALQNAIFIDSVMTEDHSFVFHIFMKESD